VNGEDGAVAIAQQDDVDDAESFPVMVRLGEIRGEIGILTEQISRFGESLERLERTVGDGVLAARFAARGDTERFPAGVTARANPMTHPVTPMSARGPMDTGRDEALETVRNLFMRRRPWWQRLPLLRS